MQTNIFVYWTLMIEDIVFALTEKKFETKGFVLKNYKRFSLKNRNYPAMIYKKWAEIKWKILYNIDEKSLKILDYFEWDEYKKEILEIDWERFLIYLWDDNLGDLIDKDWDVENFKKLYLKDYIENIIPEELKEYNLQFN